MTSFIDDDKKHKFARVPNTKTVANIEEYYQQLLTNKHLSLSSVCRLATVWITNERKYVICEALHSNRSYISIT